MPPPGFAPLPSFACSVPLRFWLVDLHHGGTLSACRAGDGAPSACAGLPSVRRRARIQAD